MAICSRRIKIAIIVLLVFFSGNWRIMTLQKPFPKMFTLSAKKVRQRQLRFETKSFYLRALNLLFVKLAAKPIREFLASCKS